MGKPLSVTKVANSNASLLKPLVARANDMPLQMTLHYHLPLLPPQHARHQTAQPAARSPYPQLPVKPFLELQTNLTG